MTGEKDISCDADWNEYVQAVLKAGAQKMIDYVNNELKPE